MMKTGSLGAPRRVDVAVGLMLIALVAVGTSQIEPESTDRAVDTLAFVCGLVAAGSLMWWRRWAPLAAGVVSVALVVYLARRYPGGPAFLAVPLSMLALGYVSPRRVAWVGVGAVLVATAIGSLIADDSLMIHLLFFGGWAAAGALAGQALAARGERAASEQERLAHAQDRAIAGERLRIAQDVHDSVAHAMATINVQSGVAAHLVEHKPEQAAVALEAIRAASRDALEELGAILGVLRDSDSAVPLAPLVGLAEIPTLVERARLDGVIVTLNQSGDIGSIAPIVGTAAYRVVQEALTNTRRHAGSAAAVTVKAAVGELGSLIVTVSDDGGSTSPVDERPSRGFGLVGMRERVEACGGWLTAGPGSPSGFVVSAVWPDRLSR